MFATEWCRYAGCNRRRGFIFAAQRVLIGAIKNTSDELPSSSTETALLCMITITTSRKFEVLL